MTLIGLRVEKDTVPKIKDKILKWLTSVVSCIMGKNILLTYVLRKIIKCFGREGI
jgi:hypothetical protein